MKSTIYLLNDFYVQNSYFRSKDGEKKEENSSKFTKNFSKGRKEKYEDEKMGSKDVEYMPGPDID